MLSHAVAPWLSRPRHIKRCRHARCKACDNPRNPLVESMSDLIPRKILFGNPHRAAVRISPDGERISFLAADAGVMNVWVAPVNDPENARVVTHDRTTGISEYSWAHTSQHILYMQDTDGDEDFHLYRVDLTTDDVLDLTPFDGISAQLNHTSHRHPLDILVGINDREEHWFHDIYRINIESGERQLIEENNQYIGFIADDDLNLRIAIGLTADSSMELFKRSHDNESEDRWTPFMSIPADEVLTTSPISLDASGQHLFMLDSRERDTSAIVSFDLDTGNRTLIFATDVADVNGILAHPTERTIQAVSYTYDRVKYAVIAPSLEKDFRYLETIWDGELEISSQSEDQSHWTVAIIRDDGPIRFYRMIAPPARHRFCSVIDRNWKNWDWPRCTRR